MESPLGEREQREAQLRAVRADLEGVSDGLGYGIEEGIVDEVAVFNAVGLNTRQSCEGHTDRGLPYAWIDISAPNMPPYATEGSRLAWEHAFARAREETGVSDERELRRHHWKVVERHFDSYKQPDDEPYLPEHIEWQRKNREYEDRAVGVLRRYMEEGGGSGIVAPYRFGAGVRLVGLQDSESELAGMWGECQAQFRRYKEEGDWTAFEAARALDQRADELEKALPRDEESVACRRAALSAFANWLKERWLAGENF